MTAPGFVPPPRPGWWVKGNHPIFGAAGSLTRTGRVGLVTTGTIILGGSVTRTRTGQTGIVTTGPVIGGGPRSLTRTGGVGNWIKTIFGGHRSLTRTGGVGLVGAQYSDNFNRADSATSVGASWTNRQNIMGINTNAAYPVSAGFNYATYNPAMIFDDMTVSITLGTSAAAGFENSEIILGSNTTGECVSFQWDVNIGQFIIKSKTSWADTGTSRSQGAGAVTTGDVLLLERVGNVYTGNKNGSTVCSWTDSGTVVPRNSSHRLVGIGGYNNFGNYRRINSWSAANI